ncbi:MAG: molybdate ABC transporter substrate-binding protein [Deltaproteobacteria bacterium]|nr:molybdate ABC transporter substrate-binding protein [Deltaproteobacteria bacterium]
MDTPRPWTRRALVGALLCSPALLRQGTAAAGAPVRIAAASDLRFALEAYGPTLAARGLPIAPTFGSSGNFAAQIAQGAPFDLFLSADDRYPAQLVASGHADGARQRVYGLGQVVLWVRTQSPLDLGPGLQVLADARVRTVAMANPRHAPYGQAAEAALRAAGLHEAVAGKLVLGDNVSQAAQFVATGAADAGLIALSLARAPTFAAAGRFVVVSGHPPLRQTGVVLRAAADPAAAAAVLDALCGAEGRALLDRFGFLPPA